MNKLKKISPAGHRVLIKVDAVEEVSKGGILIAHEHPNRMQASQTTGTLVAVGPTAWNDSSYTVPWATVGDRVIFDKHAGIIIKVAGEDYRLINDEEVTALIDEEYE